MKSLGVLVLIALLDYIITFIYVPLWNAVVTGVFHGPALSFWPAWFLLVFVTCVPMGRGRAR